MRRAINFDIDTNKYEIYTGKKYPTAYEQIRKFFYQNDFLHRQGSGYISINSLEDRKVTAIIMKMSIEFEWLKYCVKEIDVTNIGKQHSLVEILNEIIVKK